MPKLIRFSRFENYTETSPTLHEAADWSEFLLRLAETCVWKTANDFTKKRQTLVISPARYAWDARRGNNQVLGWGAWCALDIDNDGLVVTSVESAVAALTALNLNFLVYGSTKHRAEQHRFRILLELTRELHVLEIQDVWRAVIQRFAAMGPDENCKDISRIYNAPMRWSPATDGNKAPLFTFEFNAAGQPLDVDDVLASYIAPPPPAAYVPYVAPPKRADNRSPDVKAVAAALTRSREPKIKALPDGCTLFDSPVVGSDAINRYLNLGRGEHHNGLYTFMASVAGTAKAKGYSITAHHLVGYAREIDSHCLVKTNPQRWSRILDEANRALSFTGA